MQSSKSILSSFILSVLFVFTNVTYAQHTHSAATPHNRVATQSGYWQDSKTWAGGIPPGKGDSVKIPAEIEVTIAGVLAEEIEQIDVAGALKFAQDQDSSLMVRTIFIEQDGLLEIGSHERSIDSNVSVDIVFLGNHADEESRGGVSGGLVSMGKVQINGAPKIPFSIPEATLTSGTRVLQFSENLNWQVGDELVFPATEIHLKDEERGVAKVSADGKTIWLDSPLTDNHELPDAVERGVPVGNLTRNVRLSTKQSVEPGNRAHTMFMSRQTGVNIAGASFTRMGRTSALQTHTVPVSSGLGEAYKETVENTIGRYAVHFHIRSGADRRIKPHVVTNSVVRDCEKHGIVNHGGHVVASHNVTYQCNGSHFFAENGSEIGSFDSNLAIRSNGSGESFISREANFDFGHGGHGFWMQGGGGVDVKNNFAFGHSDSAYFYFGQYVVENGSIVRFNPTNARSPSLFEGEDSVWPRDVPIVFDNNVGVASKRGLDIWNHKERADHTALSHVTNSAFYANKKAGIFVPYTKRLVVDNTIIVGNDKYHGIGLNTNSKTANLTVTRSTILGYGVGLEFPRHGDTVLDGLTMQNAINIRAWSPLSRDRTAQLKDLNLKRLPNWGHLTNGRFAKFREELRFLRQPHRDFVMEGVKPTQHADLSMVFEPTVFKVESGENPYVGQQIYFPEQHPEHVPFLETGVPELDGKSNQQLWNQFKLAVGGTLLNQNAESHPRIVGYIGKPSNYPSRLPDEHFLRSPTMYDSNYARLTDDVEGEEGWKFIAVVHDGEPRTVMMYVDNTPPFLELDPRVPLEIHPDDVKYGLRLQGDVIDYVADIRTVNPVNREYRNLEVDDAGLIHVTYPITDSAGNINNVKYAIRVTETATPRGQDLARFLKKPSS